MKIYFVSAALVLLFITAASAQSTIERSVVASAGGSNVAGGYSMDWTAGEAVVNSYTIGGYTLNQGFHQSTIISLGIAPREMSVVLDAYPNPFTDQLWLKIEQPVSTGLQAVIMDVSGKQLMKAELPGNTSINHRFDMSALPSGNYLLSVYQGGVIVRTIKLIKR